MTRPRTSSFFSLSKSETVLAWLILAVVSGIVGYRLGLARIQELVDVNPTDAAELQPLIAKYGPDRNSEHFEEWILRDYFQNERGGVFLDVGANHHQRFSNTYYLETVLGWTGVALEPQAKFAGGYATFRPKTTFVPLFVSDVSNQKTTLYVTENDLVASSSPDFTGAWGSVRPTSTTTTTLDDVLDRLDISKVDFMSMDIELAEPQALAGFSIDRFRPRLVAVEAHPPVRQEILDYFTRYGYSLVGKYWRVDSENFWFAPAVAARPRTTGAQP